MLAVSPDTPRVSDPRGKYGRVDRMRSGSSLRIMRLTEFLACKLLLDPGSPDFVPPAEKPSKLYCCKCGERKPHEAFGKDERYVNRWGRRTECNPCRAKMIREARLKQRQERKKAAKLGV
jgi:hypothetical protein